MDDLRVRGISGKTIVECAGLEEIALEETEELSGLSHGAACCLRKPGLVEVDDATT